MAKKAKKPAKPVKKAKPASVKVKKAVKKPEKKAPKKAPKKEADKAAARLAKAVKKIAKLGVKQAKQAVAKMTKAPVAKKLDVKKLGAKTDIRKLDDKKKPLKEVKEPVKAAAPKGLATKVKKEVPAKATPKTLQAKGSIIIEETTVEVKVEVKPKDIILTDAEGRILCRVKDCDQPAVVEGYCRYHYLFYWKKIQNRKKILSEGKLEQYIEELTSRYPLKFLELIRKDLSSEPDFLSAIQELDIDEASTNVDDFEDENFMEEVRGISAGDTERVDDEY